MIKYNNLLRSGSNAMSSAMLPAVYDEFLDFLIEKVTPEEMLAFRASQAAQARADELTELNKTGTITPTESAELEQLLELDLLLSILKAKAFIALQNAS
jgi:hypothetical protein